MSKIAILGYGVVGSGTVEVFYKNKANYESKVGTDLDIKYILDLREFPDSPYADKFVKDFDIILQDDEIKVVVELIGGATFSYDYVRKSLLAGKSVVTSNKELVAEKGAELLAIARENEVNFFFEASVGGGIPLIRPLHQCLLTDEITEIKGILNGTTNFILTKMIRDNMDFDTALKLAQDLGYAERNPEADVEGHDTCRKICILASLCFGKHVYPKQVQTEGISKITLEDIAYAYSCKCSVKLIGWAKKVGDKAIVMVFPAFISEESQLSTVSDVFNAVLVSGEATGDVLFYGRGAGKLPTASAVVSDIVNALKMSNTSKSLCWEKSEENEDTVVDPLDISHRYYVRAKFAEVADAEKIFGKLTILHRNDSPAGELAFVTDNIQEKDFEKLCERFSKITDILGKMRIL